MNVETTEEKPTAAPRQRKRRWRRRLLFAVLALVLVVGIGLCLVVANLKRIALSSLRASLPGLRVSVQSVSLKSLSHLRVTGLKLETGSAGSASAIKLPKADVRFRLHPFKGLVLKRIDLAGARVNLRPGFQAAVSSLAKPAGRAKRLETLPDGPRIGKISLKDSRIVVNTPDFYLDCTLDALADSSSSGTVLNDTDLSLRLQLASLRFPPFQLRDLGGGLSVLIDRKADGKRLDITKGGLHLADFVQSDFRGQLSLAEGGFETKAVLNVEPFSLAELVPRLKESFPEISRYQFEGKARMQVEAHYTSAKRESLSLFGKVTVREGYASVPVPEPVQVEGVRADLPFHFSILDGQTFFIVGAGEELLTGARIVADRVMYDKQPVASDLSASLGIRNEAIELLNVFLHSYGGTVDARLSGSARGEALELEGDVNARGIDLKDAFESLPPSLKECIPELDSYEVEGKAGADVRVHYSSRENEKLRVSGNASVRRGRASAPIPKPLVVEGIRADVPIQFSLIKDEAKVRLGSEEGQPARATLVATRVTYDDEELASDVLASSEVENEVIKSLNAFFRSHGGDANLQASGRFGGDTLDLQGELNVQDADLQEVFHRLGIGDYSVLGEVSGRVQFACAITENDPVKITGELFSRVPRGTVSLTKPLEVIGLEMTAPFEYSATPDVQTVGIRPTDSYPSGGNLTAVRIGYGEKTAPDGTSGPQWTVSGVSATVVSEGSGLKLSVSSCEAYDGEVTGEVTASLEKQVLTYGGQLHVQDLDLERLMKGLGVKRDQFFMDGLAEGDIAFSGKGGKWDEAKGEFSTIPPGGIIRIEDVEDLLGSLPGGKAALLSLRAGRSASEWNTIVEALKEFRYRVVTAKIMYPPLEPRPEAGVGPDIEFHLVEKEEFTGRRPPLDIKIIVPVTFMKEETGAGAAL